MNFSPEDLLTLPEGKTLEFKRDLSSPKPLLKTLVAFANSAGGKLVVGITDNRKVIGVENPLDEEERLCNLISDAISPRLVPNIELTTVENKTLLIAEVYPSGLRPHYLKAESAETGVYVRLGSTNRQADRELIAELRRSAEGTAFDEMPMPELSVDDLDLTSAAKFFKANKVLDDRALLTLKLLRTNQGKLVPTKGAVLLFGRDRNFHFPDSWIQCGRFIGNDKAAIFDHIDIDEPLPQALESVILFLKKHAMRGADYSQRGAPIRVAFFDDRIEVENPGILLPGMTIEDMKQGISKIRNPVITRVFRELDLVEQWGSGVRRILKEAEAQGLPALEFLEIGMRLRVVVPLPGLVEVEAQSRLESRLESKLAARVVGQLLTNEMGKAELAKMLGNKTVSGELHKQIRLLLESGLIEMTLPDKPNSRLQKYRLTDKCRELITSDGPQS